MKKTALFFGLILLAISVSYAQTPEEELLKKKELKLRNYLYESKAGDRNAKVRVLEQILNEYDKAGYSDKDRRLVEIVDYLASEGSSRKEFENNLLINDFPEVRRMAIKVSAKIKGDNSRRILLNALMDDQNPTVKAEICLALASIGDNQNGDVLRSLGYMYRTTYKPDPNLVFALIEAIKNIAKGNTANYSDAIYILSEIQHGDYNRAIRTAAYDAVQALSQ
ncbi:MAG: hypothetical protein A2015_11955 [Spirochaetes bacterium GWF1_31_7]|nr:MAG: hypothetical protein A2Y30_15120 [Spirochaetes bacterium GWE1_32_154]OHD49130.1 MAG: hypothetical protein A2015_11955 [Spirochaetes bacterium GWF1_31_7]OHD50284.1 MAG: hypothetical protein A2Y29_13170 [Spirochaetes bacterium GWE2_31_10]HBD93931.1 hypothetical protein [Spirochaetia bacterium]HBI38761.1 hypothetical protein [Spirochaetia bacterium]